jgi:excinuclease UvrABC ATPase subunit
MRRFRLVIPLLGSLVLIAGCGGSSNSKLSYAAFSAAADKICANANSQAKAFQSVTLQATAANAAKIDKIVPIAQDAVKKFQALKGPDSLQAAAQTAINDLNQEIKAAQDASNAAKAGDQAAYDAALQQLAATAQQSNTDGSKLGAANCTHG